MCCSDGHRYLHCTSERSLLLQLLWLSLLQQAHGSQTNEERPTDAGTVQSSSRWSLNDSNQWDEPAAKEGRPSVLAAWGRHLDLY